MQVVQRFLVERAWDHAVTAMEATRVTREHSVTERKAWLRWWRRWRELESQGPGQRTLAVCATCASYRDGQGCWVPMPSGLIKVLASARGVCVSHGLCPACSTRALDAVKVLSPVELAGPGFARR
jgi:hypothetical protein